MWSVLENSQTFVLSNLIEIPFVEIEETRGRTEVKEKDVSKSLSSMQDILITVLLGILISQERGFHLLTDNPSELLVHLRRASQVVQLVKNLPVNAGDTRDAGSSPGLGRSPSIGNGNLPQYPCLEKSMDRGAWWATVHGLQTIGHN